MKMRVVSCVICVLLSILVIVVEVPEEVNAQPVIQWERIFGGTSEDYAHSMEKTSDGGFILVGDTGSFSSGENNKDVWLIKTDSHGNEQWNTTFNKNINDEGHSVKQTSDGGYIITGYTGTYSGDTWDLWLIKTNSSGNIQWDKTFGKDNLADIGNSVLQTSDNGYIIVGTSNLYFFNGDIWLIKTDSEGNKQWDKTFGKSEGYDSGGYRGYDDRGYSVSQTSDGGFIITGATTSYGISFYDVWLIKTDNIGNEQWNKTFGRKKPSGWYEDGHSVKQTSDGGYIVIGTSDIRYSGTDNKDMWLIKTDSQGNEQWNKTFGGSSEDRGYSIQITTDGGYILSGTTQSYGAGWSDGWLVKTDRYGNEQWNMTFGGSKWDNCLSVQQISYNNYVLIVGTRSYGPGDYDVWLIRLGPSEPTNQPPEANAGPDQTVNEDELVQFDASTSYDPDGAIETYEWDFDVSDGLWWETGATPDAIVSTPTYMYGDDGVYVATLRVTDNENLSTTDICNITVLNVDPSVAIEAVAIDVEIGLRVAGRKFNDVGMTLFEDGTSMGYVSIERMPGSPNEQMAWIPMILDMTKTYSATVTYIPEDPPNIGGNPVWIYVKFPNGSIQKIHHTFNVQQSKNRDSDHWNHVEPWEVDLNMHLVGWEFKVDYHVTDPGSDDEILTFSYSSQNIVITHLCNPPNPDPYPSPEVNPRDIYGTTKLVYEGPGTVVFIAKDDDNIRVGVGEGMDSIDVG